MVVAKFGGSSLFSAAGFRRVAYIVRKNNIPVVIVSAPGGNPKVTDLLISAYGKRESGGAGEDLDIVCARFSEIASAFDINLGDELSAIKAAINAGCSYDYAVSRGEYLSAFILAQILGYNLIDAKECVKLTLEGKIDVSSIKASGAIVAPCVIPGFYGELPSGEIRLLPRGGSDISGAAIAAAIGGEYPLRAEFQKFTDVDGIFNGHGGIIDHLSYDEAELLCYFGATVMQYESLPILKKEQVRLTVKSTFSDSVGTTVGEKRYNGYAFSSKKMFLGGEEAARHENEILNGGLKIPYKATLFNKRKILIDDCGLSPLALKRILCYHDIDEVTVTAAIGDVPHSSLGKLLFEDDVGKIYMRQKG